MKRGDAYYYFHNSGLQAQSVLYKQDSLASKGIVFLDPNTLSDDGTVSIKSFSFSDSGKYMAYALSQSGSDWMTIHVRETSDGSPLNIEPPIKWAKFTGISWTHDDKGYFYNRFKAPVVTDAGTETESNKNAKLYYHILNTPQDSDVEIFSIPDNPNHMPGAKVSDDGRYLIVTVGESCDPMNKLYICDLTEQGLLSKRPQMTTIVEYYSF
jgi:prolyl oligopeptidase